MDKDNKVLLVIRSGMVEQIISTVPLTIVTLDIDTRNIGEKFLAVQTVSPSKEEDIDKTIKSFT